RHSRRFRGLGRCPNLVAAIVEPRVPVTRRAARRAERAALDGHARRSYLSAFSWSASSAAPGRVDAQLFLGLRCTPCRWELSRLLSSITGRQAAKAKRELAGTEAPPVDLGAGLKGSL